MNLNDLERQESGGRLHLTGPVSDVAGVDTHRLTVAGPAALVPAVLGDSDFNIVIQPDAGAEDWRRQVTDLIRAAPDPEPGLDADAPFKPAPPAPDTDNTVLVKLEKQRPSGTTIGVRMPFSLRRGDILLIVLPFACSAAALTTPVVGDPDLFMDLSPFGPTVSASSLGGTAVDIVSHSLPVCLPFTGFVPFCRVVGFTATTGTFFSSSYFFP